MYQIGQQFCNTSVTKRLAIKNISFPSSVLEVTLLDTVQKPHGFLMPQANFLFLFSLPSTEASLFLLFTAFTNFTQTPRKQMPVISGSVFLIKIQEFRSDAHLNVFISSDTTELFTIVYRQKNAGTNLHCQKQVNIHNTFVFVIYSLDNFRSECTSLSTLTNVSYARMIYICLLL